MIAHLVVAAFDGDSFAASLLDVTIDEVRGDIERFRKSDQERCDLPPNKQRRTAGYPAKRAEYNIRLKGRNFAGVQAKGDKFPELQIVSRGWPAGRLFDSRTVCRKSADLQGNFADARERRQNLWAIIGDTFWVSGDGERCIGHFVAPKPCSPQNCRYCGLYFSGCKQSVILPTAEQSMSRARGEFHASAGIAKRCIELSSGAGTTRNGRNRRGPMKARTTLAGLVTIAM